MRCRPALCSHPRGFWCITQLGRTKHLTPIAGEYWVALDPFYHGGKKMRRFFNPDGSTYSPPDDPFAGYECRCVPSGYSTIRSMVPLAHSDDV